MKTVQLFKQYERFNICAASKVLETITFIFKEIRIHFCKFCNNTILQKINNCTTGLTKMNYYPYILRHNYNTKV